VRRRAKETSLDRGPGRDITLEIADTDPGPASEVENSELREKLRAAIGSLPQGYKECVVLKDMEGLSYEQIAEVLGITTEAVRSRLARARQQLRQRLTPYLKT
jgi:RNA polymerase sigma-70 factor (ECF subfamily)